MTDRLTGLHLHFDCASGAAGDMALGAFIDLGVPDEVIRDVLDKLGLGGDRLIVERIVKRGVSAVDVKVRVDDRKPHDHDHDHDHDHAHDHHHDHAHDHAHDHHHDHPHRHYRDIKQMIHDAGLAPDVVDRALDMFDRVARAEAKLHGMTVADVSFHEVGAIDSIVDIVGAAAALAWLAPASVTATSVAMGHGTLTCAHGVMPVPAPAALEIMREAGGVMADGGLARELCTPTGAAILASAVTAWTPMPPMVPVAVGYGAGDANLADRANVVRITAGRPQRALEGGEPIWQIEANIDDMSPEMCEHAAACAFEAGALDVWWTPIVMKKTRPALQLSALARESAADAVIGAMFGETTTLGVRLDRVSRRVLDREIVHVDTPYGRLPVKLARLDGRVVNAAPEYEPCRDAAHTHQTPLKQIFAAALAAYWRTDPGGM